MELTLSRNKWIAIGITALVVIVLAVSVYFVSSKGLLSLGARNPAPSTNEPAFKALNTIFTPDVSAGEDAWESQVCGGMTKDGCNLFKKLYAPTIWQAAQAGQINKVSLTFVAVQEKLPIIQNTGTGIIEDQVWKLSTDNKNQPYLYAQVAQDLATHNWLLVRILFAQEAQARYGQ